MAQIQITFDVQDVDPTRVDPHEIAEYLMWAHDIERRAGNAQFEVASEFLEAEWL